MKNLLWRRQPMWALHGRPRRPNGLPHKPVKIIIDPRRQRHRRRRPLDGGAAGKVWGQQAVIDNRPGAGGSIAVRARLAGRPTATRSMSAQLDIHRAQGRAGRRAEPADRTAARFHADRLYHPAAMFIAVSPTISVKSLPELIALAKNKPGELSYATTGRGRITHLTMELFQERAGIKLQMIPTAAGRPPRWPTSEPAASPS